jgi:hypothetical protein
VESGGGDRGGQHRSGDGGDRRRAASMTVEETGVESGDKETDGDLEF